MAKMGVIKTLKTFFEMDNGRALSLNEVKALSQNERAALAEEAAKILNVEIDYNPQV